MDGIRRGYCFRSKNINGPSSGDESSIIPHPKRELPWTASFHSLSGENAG